MRIVELKEDLLASAMDEMEKWFGDSPDEDNVDAVDESARELLAEHHGFVFFNTNHDMTTDNLKMFAELGAKAESDKENLFVLMDEYVCWATTAPTEDDLKSTVSSAYGTAYAAFKAEDPQLAPARLTEEQKEKVREDFRKYSGGFDANEAADELEIYVKHLDFHHPDLPSELVEAFLQEWSEEDH